MRTGTNDRQTVAGTQNNPVLIVGIAILVVLILFGIGGLYLLAQNRSHTVASQPAVCDMYFDVSGSVTTLNDSQKDEIKGLTDDLIDDSIDRQRDIGLYTFFNQDNANQISNFYEGKPSDSMDIWQDILDKVFSPNATVMVQGTSYSGVLQNCISRSEQADGSYGAVIISDGGVDPSDWDKTRVLARQLRGMPQFKALLILPVNDGVIRQHLQKFVLKDLGSKLIIGSDADNERAMHCFQTMMKEN